MSSFDFVETAEEIDFNIFASGRFEIIFFNLENLLVKSELYPSIPSAEVIFGVGSLRTLYSFSNTSSSFNPKNTSKSF